MKKSIRRRLIRSAVFLAAVIVTASASRIAGSFIQAETAAAKTEADAGYFGGTGTMQAAEVARASSNALLDTADFVLTALTRLSGILFAYNGGSAVYEYLKFKEKKE
jgi:hypothetical protein